MAHWHDFNPWASELVYLPSLEEAAQCIAGGEITDLGSGVKYLYDIPYIVERWQEQSVLYGTPGKLDAYLLRDGPRSQRKREMHLGVRWGKEPEEYFSPYIRHQALALELYFKYGGSRE